MLKKTDVAVVGGGIVGLATAYRFKERFPERSVLVLEKEASVGAHQSGHNSGVLHSGIYYKPGSLKSKNCREGKGALQAFCEREGIEFEICGKVIVAVDDSELGRLDAIYQRGRDNGVACTLISRERLKELEPHAGGVRAIHVPEAGIVNFTRVCERLTEVLQRGGSEVICGARVFHYEERSDCVVLESTAGTVEAGLVVNCAGLHSDRVASLSGHPAQARIVPFRGEFYELRPEAHHLCRSLIYPVPDPSFPFLGVHFTRMIEGGVECGPNAVLAFAREGYRKRDINPRDLAESLTYPGFLRLASRHWRVGAGEMWRSFSKAAFVRALQRLMPEIRSEHLLPARSGVRAQAVARDGSMVDDFLVERKGRVVNVNNAPSPAATSSLNIGNWVVEKLAENFR
ncbi:MAG: L-2-hydroxyglutarate oxidase [Planctomycetes bacterium]|nr:L-2-hydroxyglutarate oxidase [Planctomycetota bacterium]